MKMSKKILIITGDAGESFEILFASHNPEHGACCCIDHLIVAGHNFYKPS